MNYEVRLMAVKLIISFGQCKRSAQGFKAFRLKRLFAVVVVEHVVECRS